MKDTLQKSCLASVLAGFVVAAVAIWLGWLPHSLDLLITDDYAWYQSLYLMHDAIVGTAPRSEIVSSTFYGWPFWIATFGAASPFFSHAWENEAGVILASRAVESIFAGANAALFLIGLRVALSDRGRPPRDGLWLWAGLAIALLMPVWWQMATLIHPQHMMLFFEFLAVLFLLKDGGRVSRCFWLAVASTSIAFALKIEAAMLGPLFLAYLICAVHCRRTDAIAAGRAGLLALPMPFLALFILNPYLFTPEGLAGWNKAIIEHVIALHAGDANYPTLSSPLGLLTDNFYIAPVLLILLAILAVDAIRSLHKREFNPSQWLPPYIAIAIFVEIFFLNAESQNYYWLPPMLLLLYALIPLIIWLSGRPLALAALITLLVAFEAGFQAPPTFALFQHRAMGHVYSEMRGKWLGVADARQVAFQQAKAAAPFLSRARRPIISPYTDFAFRDFGVRYIDRIYGCLSPGLLAATQGRMPKPPVDMVILRKNDPALACEGVRGMISRWRAPDGDFSLLQETPYIWVFGRRGSVN